MAWLHQLADVARRTGFPVKEEWGWQKRGHGQMGTVRAVIAHHDAARHSPGQFNTVIRDGHSTLNGPLSHYALRRDGTIHVVAAGKCWHAGVNINPYLYDNSHSIGIEAGNDGVGEPWPRVQLEAYEALCGELAREFNLKTSRVRGHKEIAPARKIDPHGINMKMFRKRVADYLSRDKTPTHTDDDNGDTYMKLEPAGDHATATLIPWRNGLQLVVAVGDSSGGTPYPDLVLHNVKQFYGSGKVAHVKNYHDRLLKPGTPENPTWDLEILNGVVAVRIEYSYSNTVHTASAGFRAAY